MDTITSKAGTSGVVVGWGRTSNSQSIDSFTGAYSAKQQKLEVPILDVCESGGLNRTLVVSETQICAGGEEEKDSCRGDSGGGLFWRSDLTDNTQSWYLLGIVSFGSKECGIGHPAVYTRVSAYRTWIKEKMALYD